MILQALRFAFPNADPNIISRNPMISSLLLFAKPVDSEGVFDSFLTGEETSGLNLKHVGLVTLSACSAGTGKIVDGEGQFGNTNGFFGCRRSDNP